MIRESTFFFHIQSISLLIVEASDGGYEMMMQQHRIYDKVDHVIDHDTVDR